VFCRCFARGFAGGDGGFCHCFATCFARVEAKMPVAVLNIPLRPHADFREAYCDILVVIKKKTTNLVNTSGVIAASTSLPNSPGPSVDKT
jgi:hypothetical protein